LPNSSRMRLGVSRQTAYRHMARALEDLRRKTRKSTAAMVQLELERLDYVLGQTQPKVEAGDHAGNQHGLEDRHRAKLP